MLTWAADAGQEGRVCWPRSSSLTLLARGALETSSGVTQDKPDPRERRHDQGGIEGANAWSWGWLWSTPFLPPSLASFPLLFSPNQSNIHPLRAISPIIPCFVTKDLGYFGQVTKSLCISFPVYTMGCFLVRISADIHKIPSTVCSMKQELNKQYLKCYFLS